MRISATVKHPLSTPFYARSSVQRMDQAAVKTRIRRLIAEKAGGKQQDFADMIDIQASMLSKMLSGREQIKRGHLVKIEKATAARLAWLEWGVEPIYYEKDQIPERSDDEYFEGYRLRAYLDEHNIEYSELARRLSKSKNTVQGYFKTETLGKSNRQAILAALNASYEDVFGGGGQLNGKVSKPQPVSVYSNDDDENLVEVVDVPVTARAGFGYQAFMQGQDVTFTRIPKHMLYPGVKPTEHCIVEVNGDSMEPELRAGYRMLAYKRQSGQWGKLNSIVMVDYRDEFIIKELAGIDDVHHTILLRSKNGGATRNISMNEIRAIYHVYRYYDAKLF